MNSFTLTAVGQLARNPEVVAKSDVAYTRFCLVGNDYGGKDDEGATREVVTSIWFVAFGSAGEAIAHHARKGDQLIVEARVRANVWTDKQGEKQYDHSFVVQGFRFGAPGRAKREEREGRREHTLGLPRGENRGNENGIGRNQRVGHGPNGEGGEGYARSAGDVHGQGPDEGAREGATVEVNAAATVESSAGPGAGPNATAAAAAASAGRSDAADVAAVGNAAADAEGSATTTSVSASNTKSRGSRSSRKALAATA